MIPEWFKPKKYVHFLPGYSYKNPAAILELLEYVKSPHKIANHSFFPLLFRPEVNRRFKKSGKDQDSRTHWDAKKKKSMVKQRNIFYCNHRDSVIYSHYAKEIIQPLYEDELERRALSGNVLAYRKILVPGTDKGKNNIHFAHEVFNDLKEQGECVVLGFDVSAFFDSLNHNQLKKNWIQILEGEHSELPSDHYRIFKSLTRFRFVNYHKLKRALGVTESKIRSDEYTCFFKMEEDFRRFMKGKGLVSGHPFIEEIDGKKVFKGIPQGTPISAVLSNIYMLDFDSAMKELVEDEMGGIYRRYSDDILAIVPQKHEDELKAKVYGHSVEKYNLDLNPDKETRTSFELIDGVLHTPAPLQFLGFEFNGRNIHIRGSSLSKNVRKMKRTVRRETHRAKRACHKHGLNDERSRIRVRSLMDRFTHYGSKGSNRNFYKYAKRASEIMNEPSIQMQLANSALRLNKEIDKWVDRKEVKTTRGVKPKSD